MTPDKNVGNPDICTCETCGIREHIHLLDGKLDANGEHEKLECIRCYGPGWAPVDFVDFAAGARSVAPELKPFYQAVQTARRSGVR